jgi:hypothetical protein
VTLNECTECVYQVALGDVALEQHHHPAEVIDTCAQLRQQCDQFLILERAGRKAIDPGS